MSAETGKRCPRCGLWKPLEDFARDCSKASGRKSACKVCDAAKSRAYYAANRVRLIARQVAYQRRAREAARRSAGSSPDM